MLRLKVEFARGFVFGVGIVAVYLVFFWHLGGC
jgi:hypothetical protein